MNAQDCWQILRDVKDAAFATVDEKGVPQVRIIDVMLAENEKIYLPQIAITSWTHLGRRS